MDSLIENKISCIPVFQNQQDFLIGVFSINSILKFTRYTQRLIIDFDESNQPIYNDQIQRELENPRVQKIADFLIEDPNATFPTNIVLHIPANIIKQQYADRNRLFVELDEKVFDNVAKAKSSNNTVGHIFISIIDGQHRVRGIEVALERINAEIQILRQILMKNSDNKDIADKLDRYLTRQRDLLNINLVVSFFVDKSLEYQAMVFSTINRTQKRVSDSLVYSLFGLTTSDSPYKTALQVVLTLNSHSKSPFYNRVNLYGSDFDFLSSPPLSQATMVKSIVLLISESVREADRDRNRQRKDLFARSPGSTKYLPFRKYYSKDEDDKISDIFFYFFSAVSEVFVGGSGESLWYFNPETMKASNVLQTSVGYFALLNTLVDVLEEMSEEQRFSSQYYKAKLELAREIDFQDTARYPLTSKSRSILYLDLNIRIWPPQDNSDPRLARLRELLSK